MGGAVGRGVSHSSQSVLCSSLFPSLPTNMNDAICAGKASHAHDKDLSPRTTSGGTRETNNAATAPAANDQAAQPTLACTPGLDSCSTPAAAIHATPAPRTTRVTRTA
eukprot:6192113-Pleurochrysis_carterae.AAC.2